MRSLLILTCLALLASCAQFPEVNQATSRNIGDKEFPTLIPIQDVVDPGPGYLNDDSASNLEGRISGLKRRADELRQQQID